MIADRSNAFVLLDNGAVDTGKLFLELLNA